MALNNLFTYSWTSTHTCWLRHNFSESRRNWENPYVMIAKLHDIFQSASGIYAYKFHSACKSCNETIAGSMLLNGDYGSQNLTEFITLSRNSFEEAPVNTTTHESVQICGFCGKCTFPPKVLKVIFRKHIFNSKPVTNLLLSIFYCNS